MPLLSKVTNYTNNSTSLYIFGLKLLTKHRYIGGGGGKYFLFDKLYLFSSLSENEKFCLKNALYIDCSPACIDINALESTLANAPHKIDALVRGLDERSRTLIYRQLEFMLRAKNSRLKLYIDLLPHEKVALRAIREMFLSVTYSANAWRLGALALPIMRTEPSVMLQCHGIPTLKHLDKTKAVIDAGAFIGDSALIMRKLCDISGEIHCFEPMDETYLQLLETISLNALKNIVPVKLGLGSKKMTLNLSECPSLGGEGAEGGKNKQAVERKIQITSIDEYVSENNLQVGLIKVDIEGAEQELLKGTLKTIISQRPALIISIYHSLDDYLEIKPMLEALNAEHNLGYKIYIDKGIDESVIIDTCVYCDPS